MQERDDAIAELEARANGQRSDADMQTAMDCDRRGISVCCRAPLDMSALRRHGSRTGGPIFCSRCGNVVAWA